MLEDSLLESRGVSKGRVSATLISSAGIHLAIIAALVLIPLLQIYAVPALDVSRQLSVPQTHDDPIPLVPTRPHIQTQIQVDPAVVSAPQSIPREIAYFVEPPSVPIVAPSNSGAASGFGSILRGMANSQTEPERPMAPPPPPAPAAPEQPEPVRIGGNVQQANLIHQVRPVYPPIAIQVRAQGVVVLEAVINEEGTIDSLRVVSGHPLLVPSALDAVKQWVYRPTLLNGVPVGVITTITVNFSLQ